MDWLLAIEVKSIQMDLQTGLFLEPEMVAAMSINQTTIDNELRRRENCGIICADKSRTACRAGYGTGEKYEDIRKIFELCSCPYCQQ